MVRDVFVMSFDELAARFASGEHCGEIAFRLIGSDKFTLCWMGKQYSADEKRDVYWCGLTADGQNAYEFTSFAEMAGAPVFDGKTLKDVWGDAVVLEIDGCDPKVYIQHI